MYENRGHIKEHASNEEVYKDVAQQYLQHVMKQPNSKGIVIAATNEERLALNKEIRNLLKDNGLLPKEDLLQRGEAEGRPPADGRLSVEGQSHANGHFPDGYTVGDRIVFTKNDRGWNTNFTSKKEGFFVQNSMQAVIHSIKPVRRVDEETGEITQTSQIVAHTFDDQGKIAATIWFNLDEYKHFTPGYAVTGWKSQGNTLDWVIAKLSKYMDAYALYVIATRHREEISMHYSKEDFSDYKALVHSLSRATIKDLVVDYSVSDENKEYWQNVQDYKETGRELQGIRAFSRSLDKDDKEKLKAVWENYREAEADRKSWAKFIIGDWEVHKDFVRQAGLTRESLEIAAGLKKRAMSRVEIEAQQTVEQYAAVSLEARTLWRDIRRTHPGSRARAHPEWARFEEARDQRGVLANQIHINPVLHRPFLKEIAENLAKADIGYVSKDNKISYSMATIKVQAEANQSKMLQIQLLKDNTQPAQQDMIKALIGYTENRDMAGAIWQEIRPKLKAFERTLLKESFSKAISEYTEVRIKRDAAAFQIMERQEAFTNLAERVGIKLDFERLGEQALQATRDRLFKTYQSSPEGMAKLEAAFEINALVGAESELGKKPTISQVYQQGLQPKDITRDAIEYQKIKLFEGLKTEPERGLFLLLDEYDSKCRAANRIYGQCIEETKGKDKHVWESSHYPSYKAACNERNDVALEVFDQRDHNQVIAMAEGMGIRVKDIDLIEIFSRCEQATRTNNIISYLKGEDPETKGKAAAAVQQMIQFERREATSPSKTAQQAYHSGIDFKELQILAFEYERSSVLKELSSEKEIEVYHCLEAYENALKPATRAYKECIDESKEKTTKILEVKPWETEKFKEYISLVTVQDEKAYDLIKGYDAPTVTKIARQMGIACKKLDVEAHRHSLRQTIQTYREGDHTNVPMAAYELLNWLNFDRHSDHKHTFKILKEQDLWPKDIQDGLQKFIEKKREWRHEEHRDVKHAAKERDQGQNSLKPEYRIITYERYQSFAEVEKQLKERMFDLATDVLGNPTSRTSTQLRFGKKGSISVFTGGSKVGLYSNHETGVYGGPLKLIEDQVGHASPKDSLKWASEWLGGNALVIEQRIVEKQQKQKTSTWTPITPVQKALENPDIEGNKYLNYRLKDGYTEVGRYAYRDEEGNLKGYVFRFEKPNPEDPDKNLKVTPPLAYCENEKGFKAWRWQGFFCEQKTAYGLEKLSQNPTKPVLVVEGEKKADAAQKMLPGYCVLSWIGGAGSVGNTNWECLAGREVIIWPDNDEGGLKAANTLQKIVSSVNMEKGLNGSVGIVSLPSDLPEKWDLADKLPENWTVDTIQEMIREAIPQKSIEKESQPLEKTDSITKANTTSPQKSYSAEEQEILAYLKEDINLEKHRWLRKEHVQNLLNAAESDPLQALARWQNVSGDYSFAPSVPETPLTKEQREALELQGNDIRLYLQDAINPEKHSWLREEHAQNLLNAAESDPLQALARWQDVSGDYSFKPLMPEALMNKEQLVFKETIMDYLNEVVRPEKCAIVDEAYRDKLFKMMDRDPLKTLQEWQKDSRDYTFNPFKEQLNDREIRVQEYIIEKILDEERPFSKHIYADVTANLLDKPLEAYQTLQIYTADKTFDPSTGIPKIEMDAQELVTKIKDFTNTDLINGLEERLSSSPESVINECNALILRHEKDTQLESAVNKFVTLTEQLDKMAWHDPAHDETFHALSSLVEENIKNREFRRMVEGSKSSVAIEKLHDEIEERQQQQHTFSR